MSACHSAMFPAIPTLTHDHLTKLVMMINNHVRFDAAWMEGEVFGNPFLNIVKDDELEMEEGELITTMDDDGRYIFIGMFGGQRRVVYERYVPIDETVTLISVNESDFEDLIECNSRMLDANSFHLFLACFDGGDTNTLALMQLEEEFARTEAANDDHMLVPVATPARLNKYRKLGKYVAAGLGITALAVVVWRVCRT